MSYSQQRSDLSPKNKYWIPKYRYLELKNFCLQYQEWKKAILSISEVKTHLQISTSGNFSDPTESIALKKMKYQSLIDLIEQTAADADPDLAPWIIKGVAKSLSYEFLRYQLDLPAGREMYYDRYRRFFWLLDQRR